MKKVQLRHSVELLMSQKGEHAEALETVGDHAHSPACSECSGIEQGEEGRARPGSQKAGDIAPSLCSSLLARGACTFGRMGCW